MAERHTRGTSRGNAGGRAWVLCIRRTWDRVLHTADTRRLVRRPHLDPRDWLGTSDSFLGHTVYIAKRVAAWHDTVPFLAGLLFGNPHTAETRTLDTTNLVLTMLAKVSRTVGKPYRQGTATPVCVWRGTGLSVADRLFGKLHTVDRRSSGTTSLVSPLVSKVCCTVGRPWRSLPPSWWLSANTCDKCRRWPWSHTGASGTH